ncbi:purine-nucleoside phosphorylase [Peptoniphilus equinus]|uniref:Purine nucleoside phosphorylase n=1 Tax=Peptoniphilus equinus TaxID=3016343 RepID=A0ABY7QSW3_9FIRM|nr:purine-nucleoside phosphorylase [Peptoniphilus equinus]WBW49556.1 purine-nucleoside phosphorylase [Peptoniphilus equinus]
MIPEKSFTTYQHAADYILARLPHPVDVAIVLGTGLGTLLDAMDDKVEIPYRDIPGFLLATAPNHPGKFIAGKLAGRYVICMSGRFHYYEGYDYSDLATPVYVLKLLGVTTLILTNAAGAINYNIHPGDICVITDHLNFATVSPTRGNNLDAFGPRFYPIDNLYDRDLRRLAMDCAVQLGFSLKEGVYFYTVGPFFETPSEIRAMRLLGADLVGMSTITESLTAGHCGVKVLGLSLATNYSSDRIEGMDGSEVEDVAERASAQFRQLILKILSAME